MNPSYREFGERRFDKGGLEFVEQQLLRARVRNARYYVDVGHLKWRLLEGKTLEIILFLFFQESGIGIYLVRNLQEKV